MANGDAWDVQGLTLPWTLLFRTQDLMYKGMKSFLPVEVEMLVLFFTNLQSQMSYVMHFLYTVDMIRGLKVSRSQGHESLRV